MRILGQVVFGPREAHRRKQFEGTFARAGSRLPSQRRSDSVMWSPIVRIGLIPARGSWKTIAASMPAYGEHVTATGRQQIDSAHPDGSGGLRTVRAEARERSVR